MARRRLVDEVVLDDDERSLSSTMPQLPDPRLAARAVYDGVAGFGPLQRHLEDPDVEEVWTNRRLRPVRGAPAARARNRELTER